MSETSTEATAELRPVAEDPTPKRRPRRLAHAQGLMTATSGVWFGLVVVAAGFVAIFYSWGKVAGLVNVAQQIPYVVSGGLAGLGLIIVGVTIVDVAVRRQDSQDRRRTLRYMSQTLADLHTLLEPDEDNERED